MFVSSTSTAGSGQLEPPTSSTSLGGRFKLARPSCIYYSLIFIRYILYIYQFMFIFMFYDEWQVVQWCVVLESGVSVSIVPCSDPLFHITDQTCNILCSMFDDVQDRECITWIKHLPVFVNKHPNFRWRQHCKSTPSPSIVLSILNIVNHCVSATDLVWMKLV